LKKQRWSNLKISNNFKQNIDETDSKQPKKFIGKSIPAFGF
jgi:hypothetical protein